MNQRNEIRLGMLAPCVCIVAACAVGPDFKQPSADVPADWSARELRANADPRTSATIQRAPEATAWWREFKDPLLSSLIERAAAANLDVRQALLRIAEARAQRDVAAAAWWPNLSLNASYQRQRLSENTQNGALLNFAGAGGVAPAALSNPFSQYQLGVDASWEIDLFGRIRRSVEASDADTLATIEDSHDVFISLFGEVARTYNDLRGAQLRLSITTESLATQHELLELTEQRRSAGLTNELDVANASALAESTAALLPQFERVIAEDTNQLSRLLGQSPGALRAELSDAGAILSVPPEVPVGLPADLVRRRPDIRRVEARLHAATARAGVAVADLFPQISLGASAGFQSETSSQLTDWASRFFRIGPTIELPVFSGQRWATVRLQDVRVQEAANEYARTVLAALHEVDNALLAYDKEQRRQKSLQAAVAHNEDAVQLADQRYRNGVASFIDVLDAERVLQQNKLQLVDSETAIATNLVTLYKALGGGWETTQVNQQGVVTLGGVSIRALYPKTLRR